MARIYQPHMMLLCAALVHGFLLAPAAGTAAAESPMDAAMNSMGRLMGNPAGYDPAQLADIKACMAEHNLTSFGDAAWGGFLEYATNGSYSWGKANGTGFIEYDPRPMDLQNITVYETCNFASNMAYYRTMLGVCDAGRADQYSMSSQAVHALIQSYAGLASGSAFYHAQGSSRGRHSLGNRLDNIPIATLAYVAHQVSVSALNNSQPLLSDLTPDNTYRNRTAIELAGDFIAIVEFEDVSKWNHLLNTRVGDIIADYYAVFGAIVTSMLNLIFPEEIADPLVKLIATIVAGKDEAKFLTQKYAPTFRNATKDVKLSVVTKASLALRGAGTVMKLVYAFLWQEKMIPWFGLHDAGINRLGGQALPFINKLANMLTGYKQPSKDVQDGVNVYPGDQECRVGTSPHTKWHEAAGTGLLDLMHLADDMNRILRKGLKEERGWMDFWRAVWRTHFEL